MIYLTEDCIKYISGGGKCTI